jgi:hypothetical protein
MIIVIPLVRGRFRRSGIWERKKFIAIMISNVAANLMENAVGKG